MNEANQREGIGRLSKWYRLARGLAGSKKRYLLNRGLMNRGGKSSEHRVLRNLTISLLTYGESADFPYPAGILSPQQGIPTKSAGVRDFLNRSVIKKRKGVVFLNPEF